MRFSAGCLVADRILHLLLLLFSWASLGLFSFHGWGFLACYGLVVFSSADVVEF